MLPLGFGWSLLIHLFVQFPKTLGAIAAALVISSLPVERTGLAPREESVGRLIVCTLVADALAAIDPGAGRHAAHQWRAANLRAWAAGSCSYD